MIHKYNYISFKERFDFTDKEVEQVVDLRLCLPIGWNELNDRQKIARLRDKALLWSLDEVERLDKILQFAKDKHLLFYKTTLNTINDLRSILDSRFANIEDNFKAVQLSILELRDELRLDEAKIDFKYFCEVTGYAIQSFRNNMEKTDDKGMAGRLHFPIYNNLVWQKIKGRWKTSLKDFLELRAGLKYEDQLNERKLKNEPVRQKLKKDEMLDKLKDNK